MILNHLHPSKKHPLSDVLEYVRLNGKPYRDLCELINLHHIDFFCMHNKSPIHLIVSICAQHISVRI